MDIQKGVNMKTRIVNIKDIPKAEDNGEIRTKFSKALAQASVLKKGKALELSYSRNKLALKARGTLCAVIRKKKLRYRVVLRRKRVYIIRE
jgi:hypothetical protein